MLHSRSTQVTTPLLEHQWCHTMQHFLSWGSLFLVPEHLHRDHPRQATRVRNTLHVQGPNRRRPVLRNLLRDLVAKCPQAPRLGDCTTAGSTRSSQIITELLFALKLKLAMEVCAVSKKNITQHTNSGGHRCRLGWGRIQNDMNSTFLAFTSPAT